MSGTMTDKRIPPTSTDSTATMVGSSTEIKFWIRAVTSSSACAAILLSAPSVSPVLSAIKSIRP